MQLYKCMACGHQFRAGNELTKEELWVQYSDNKQTYAELAQIYNVSVSTIQRKLRDVEMEWKNKPLVGAGYVHLDATYWGRGWGILLAIDEEYGMPLYMAFIKSETVKDYKDAITNIEERGYVVKGVIVDGKQSLFEVFAGRNIQMCQFHMKQIIRRYITLNPRLKAAKALKELLAKMTTMKKDDFEKEYAQWKIDWGRDDIQAIRVEVR